MELGGKSPVVICEDAHIEAAATRVAWGKWAGNCGQFCITPDYVLVVESLKDKFIQCLKRLLVEFYGENPYLSKDYGRLISISHAQRTVDLISNDKTIRIVHGNQDRHLPQERYVEPTIVEATAASKIMAEEIFGPILAIIGVKSTEDAVEFINEHFNNHNHHPLALYVFSKSYSKQRYVLDNVMSGMACVNHIVFQGGNFHLPFGGVGFSGLGAYYGKHGFDFFSHQRGAMVFNNHSTSRLDPGNWLILPPYTETKTKFLNVMGRVPFLLGHVTTFMKLSLPALVAILLCCYSTQVREFNLNMLIGWMKAAIPFSS